MLVPAEGASIGPTCLYSVGSRQDRRGRPIYPAILAPAEGVSIGPTCLYYGGSRQLGTGVAGLSTPPRPRALASADSSVYVGSRQLGTGTAGLFTPAMLVPAEGANIGRLRADMSVLCIGWFRVWRTELSAATRALGSLADGGNVYILS